MNIVTHLASAAEIIYEKYMREKQDCRRNFAQDSAKRNMCEVVQ